MTKKLLNALTNLIIDKDFQALSTRCRATSLFEMIKFDENRKSDALAWLLNPNEGHQLGEYFAKALLNYAYSCATDYQLEHMPQLHNLLSISLSNISVMRELAIKLSHSDKGKNANKYIDIVIADAAQKLIVVIERKDGSTAKNNQLANYASWVNDHYSDWKKIFILSDSENRNHSDEYDERYVQIDDSWLSDALLDLFERGFLTPQQEYQLRDIHDFVFIGWDESRDRYYKNLDSIIKRLANSHSELLRELENPAITIENKRYSWIEISPTVYFSQILPNAAAFSKSELNVFELIQLHYGIFEYVHGYNEFDVFDDKLKRLNSHIRTELHSDYVDFSLEHHLPEEGRWPYGIEVRRNDDEIISYTATLWMSKYADEEYHVLAESVATRFDLEFKRRKRLSKVLCSQLTELDLSPGSVLYTHILQVLKKLEEVTLDANK